MSAYIKEEIQPDAVSMKSANSIAPETQAMNASLIQQPDFKKKKQENRDPLATQLVPDNKNSNN